MQAGSQAALGLGRLPTLPLALAKPLALPLAFALVVVVVLAFALVMSLEILALLGVPGLRLTTVFSFNYMLKLLLLYLHKIVTISV